MNKRIYKKKHGTKKVSLKKLFAMTYMERVEYFQKRNPKRPPIMFKYEWGSANYANISHKYESSDEEWEDMRLELAKINKAHE